MARMATFLAAGGVLRALILALILLAGCAPGPIAQNMASPLPQPGPIPQSWTAALPTNARDVPFTTLAVSEKGTTNDLSYGADITELRLLTSIEDTSILAATLLPADREALSAVDFDRYAVLALFRDFQPGAHYRTVIERVVNQYGRLIVYAQLWEPGANALEGGGYTNPYHLVQIDRRHMPSALPAAELRSYTVETNLLNASAPPNRGETIVPFTSIGLDDFDGGGILNTAHTEGLQWLLLTSPEQIEEISLAPEHKAVLQLLDWDRVAAIALFRGTQPSCGYRTEISAVTRRTGRLTVYAELWEPGGGYGYCAAHTNPYHVVAIDRRDLPTSAPALMLQPFYVAPTPLPGSPGG